jgi:conjugative transfer signal peptidase TraF
MSRISKRSAVVGASLLALAALAWPMRINTTKSIPVGFYWMTSELVKKGSYVIFCPPETELFDTAKERGYIGAGFCPGGYGYMMKRVVAITDDAVVIAGDGVHVNGELLPLSVPRAADRAGRLIPRNETNWYTLGASELLLMSDISGTSFDGRYFGPIHRKQVQGVIRPILTW